MPGGLPTEAAVVGPPQSEAPSPAQAVPPAPVPETPPAEPMSRPSVPVLTPPVPIAMEPPKHPAVWRVVIETPGLAAGARPEGTSARVRLRVKVLETGAVGDVQIAVPSGRPELDAAAVAAARSWRFHPARRDGVPVASTVLIWVAFVVEP